MSERWERCAGCGREYAYPHLCREHMLCGICHPPTPDIHDEPRCPDCGATRGEHADMQAVVNQIRALFGLPPVDPPDIYTGHQRRSGTYRE